MLPNTRSLSVHLQRLFGLLSSDVLTFDHFVENFSDGDALFLAVNRVTLMGGVTDDPEESDTGGGRTVVKFRVVTKISIADDQG